jgi:uncharacterized FAD-dependent dehydrogenase
MIRITDIKIKLEEVSDSFIESRTLRKIISGKLKIHEKDILSFRIFRKSIDARKKGSIFYVYTVDAEVTNEQHVLKRCKQKCVSKAPQRPKIVPPSGSQSLPERPVIIGMGPAGLFAGLILSRYGYMPVILERGKDVDERTADINRFWNNGVLNTESNVQFGEGGAGTFSDGKLTTLINDKRCHVILEEFVKAGAPGEILYKSKPHIGTDLLKTTVKSIRQQIISKGGEVRFNSKVTDFEIENGEIKAVIVNENERIKCQVLLLAIGHSARDTFEVLYKRGVAMTSKSFSIGVRIEHLQRMIDEAQYGDLAGHEALYAADYKLSYHSASGRSCYTFCMCPGGYVVAAASEGNCVVTNGMSIYKRDGTNANSALLVGITPNDFESSHPLAGIDFQRKWERLAYKAGGNSYKAPAQLLDDFLNDRVSTGWGDVLPTYKPGVVFADMRSCLPGYVIDTLKEAALYFGTRLKGFDKGDSILTGVETRSSSPVRIIRNKDYLSNIKGLYPMGEGSGYAGGIMSSAVDGLRIAEKIMEKYAPIK